MKKLVLLLLFFINLYANEMRLNEIRVFSFNDVNRSYTVEQIISGDETLFTTELDPVHAKFPKQASVWLKVTFSNSSDTAMTKVVKFLDIRLDQLDMYDASGQLLRSEGDRIPFNQRRHKDAQIAVDIEAEPLTNEVLYINLLNEDRADASYLVYDQEAYKEHLITKKMVHAFFFGALVIMLLYNFVLYLFIRESVFLLYVLYHTALLVVMLYYNGIVSEYFYAEDAGINGGNVPRVWMFLAVILATEFLRSFLQVKEHTPRLDKALVGFIVLNITLMILESFGITQMIHPQIGVIFMMPLSIFLLFVASYHAVVKKRVIAVFYVLGWSIMMLSIIITGLLSLGWIPRNDVTSYIFQIGSFIEVALLSMGLAYRYNEKRDEIIEKDRALKSINENLEATIKERTVELDKEVKYTKSLLDDREILFKELYHRVKNNLQMLTSLLSMQMKRVDDENSKGVLQDFIGRIKSLALLHEKLQSSNQLDRISMQEYLRSFLEEVKNANPFVNLEFDLQSQNIYLKIDQVTPIGLIVNELTSNSFKHAFDNVEKPKITVHLKEINDTHLELFYSDNGSGASSLNNSKSLGTVLIDTLGKSQLKGEITIKMKPSLSYSIVFPKL